MAAADARSIVRPGTAYPGICIGGEGGLNWLLNNCCTMDTGYAVGGKIGFAFVGPRVELEGLYRNNRGRYTVQSSNSSFNCVTGQVNRIPAMANLVYDFAPGATITPYVGAGAGLAFVDPSLSPGCCSATIRKGEPATIWLASLDGTRARKHHCLEMLLCRAQGLNSRSVLIVAQFGF